MDSLTEAAQSARYPFADWKHREQVPDIPLPTKINQLSKTCKGDNLQQ